MDNAGLRMRVEEDGVAWVTMCNGTDNKFNMDYVRQWNLMLDEIEKNDKVVAMVTSGQGNVFSSGLDVTWLQKQTAATLDLYHDELHALYKRILSLGVTTVALINGHAIAEGAFIALMHDFRVMRGDRGWINWPEVHLKLPFTKTILDLFRIKVQNGKAHREALVFGKRLDAKTAKELGIVDIVTSPDDMVSVAKRVVKDAIGQLKVTPAFFNDMKYDMYNSFVVDEKLSGKL